MIRHSILPPDTLFNFKDITITKEHAEKYTIRTMGAPLGLEEAINLLIQQPHFSQDPALQRAIEFFSKPALGMIESKVTTTFTSDLCAEIDRLESQLNNITRIVAEAKANFAKNQFTTVSVVEVDAFIADLEAALVAKEALKQAVTDAPKKEGVE